MILFPSLIFGICLILWFFKPEYVANLFVLNLWALSYPHTFATFKRSYFLKKENKIKALFIILLFLIFNIYIVYVYDFVLLINIYFYSQFFHYCRQNFGISKIYSKVWLKLDTVIFHFYHVFVLLFFWRTSHAFLGYKIFSPSVSELISTFSMYSMIASGIYFLSRFKKVSSYTFIYLLLGAIMTYSSESFILGWLGLHLFHNSQYLVMGHRLSQRSSFLFYWLTLVVLVLIIYSIAKYFDQFVAAFVPLSFCLILSVNYSHYFFDTYLWKRKFRDSYP